MAEQTITLTPGEGKLVSFQATPHEAKTYQVSVNGLTGSFMVIRPEPSAYLQSLLDSLNSAHALVADGYAGQWCMISPPPGFWPAGVLPPGYPGQYYYDPSTDMYYGDYGLQSAQWCYSFIPRVIKAEAILTGLVESSSQISFFHDKSTYEYGVVSMLYDSNILTGPADFHNNGKFF